MKTDNHEIESISDRLIQAEQKLWRYEDALILIAIPMRPDGTYNRDRGACQVLAEKVLKGE